MVVDVEMINWDSIQAVMEAFKDEEFVKSNFYKVIKVRLQRMKALIKDNWDDQEINIDDEGKYFGIPIELASLVLYVFKYAADQDINLVDALEKVAENV